MRSSQPTMRKRGPSRKAAKARPPVVLLAVGVDYYSKHDEQAFFEWLQRIDGFKTMNGVGGELRIYIEPQIDKYGLRDLIGLFFRYNVDLTQIPRAFPRRSWMRQETAYWFAAMFPSQPAQRPKRR